jgi:hypothetical protein
VDGNVAGKSINVVAKQHAEFAAETSGPTNHVIASSTIVLTEMLDASVEKPAKNVEILYTKKLKRYKVFWLSRNILAKKGVFNK